MRAKRLLAALAPLLLVGIGVPAQQWRDDNEIIDIGFGGAPYNRQPTVAPVLPAQARARSRAEAADRRGPGPPHPPRS